MRELEEQKKKYDQLKASYDEDRWRRDEEIEEIKQSASSTIKSLYDQKSI